MYDDSLMIHIITLRIQALSLVESDDLLGDRRTELRYTKPCMCDICRSCMCDICKILTFSNFQMFGWIKSKLFTCSIMEFPFYYVKQRDKILPLSVQL